MAQLKRSMCNAHISILQSTGMNMKPLTYQYSVVIICRESVTYLPNRWAFSTISRSLLSDPNAGQFLTRNWKSVNSC